MTWTDSSPRSDSRSGEGLEDLSTREPRRRGSRLQLAWNLWSLLALLWCVAVIGELATSEGSTVATATPTWTAIAFGATFLIRMIIEMVETVVLPPKQ